MTTMMIKMMMMTCNPCVTNIQWIHSIGSFPCGKAAGTLSCDIYRATPSYSPETRVYKMHTKSETQNWFILYPSLAFFNHFILIVFCWLFLLAQLTSEYKRQRRKVGQIMSFRKSKIRWLPKGTVWRMTDDQFHKGEKVCKQL